MNQFLLLLLTVLTDLSLLLIIFKKPVLSNMLIQSVLKLYSYSGFTFSFTVVAGSRFSAAYKNTLLSQYERFMSPSMSGVKSSFFCLVVSVVPLWSTAPPKVVFGERWPRLCGRQLFCDC